MVVLRTALAGGTVGTAGAVIAALGIPPLLVSVLLRFTPAIPCAVGLTGAGYVVGRAHHTTVDGWAAVVGALLFAGVVGAAGGASAGRLWSYGRPAVSRQADFAEPVLALFALAGTASVLTVAIATLWPAPLHSRASARV